MDADSPITVVLDFQGNHRRIGLMRRNSVRKSGSITFEYDPTWVKQAGDSSIIPSLPVGPGTFTPPAGHQSIGCLADSAPDSWGRKLMRRAEKRAAQRERRTAHTLGETDFLLGVADSVRQGALRENGFLAQSEFQIPGTTMLGRLLEASRRFLRSEESEQDMELLLMPGSALGGARPKASFIDRQGNLCLAKFPKVALDLAGLAGIQTASHELVENAGQPVFLTRRFDRHEGNRIPFLSAMSMTGHIDGERGSYLEILDAIDRHGARSAYDRTELFRRITFSVLASNTDDHLRNHGFLWLGEEGWTLSPAYDINPVPQDLKPRVLSTNLDFDNGDCSLDLLRSVAEMFALSPKAANDIIRQIANVTHDWRVVARKRGAKETEICRMASAFEHDDLRQALTL